MAALGTRREQRLRHRRDIGAVYRRGQTQRGNLLRVLAVRTNLRVSRFGFAVPGSAGNAVGRNRIRRRLREVMRMLPVGAGWDVMLTVRPAARAATFRQLRDGAESALRQLRVLEPLE